MIKSQIMRIEAENKPNFDKPVIAIKSSMLAAHVHILGLEPKQEKIVKLKRIQTLAEFTETQTEDKCSKATYFSLAILAKQYSDLFQTMLAIRAWQDRQSPFVNQDWDHHQYLLALDIQNRWYGASPANYEIKNPVNRLDNLISGDLENVLAGIKDIEGGTWPSQEYIEKVAFSSPYAKPNVFSVDKILGLRIDSHGKRVETTELVDYVSGKEIDTVEKRIRKAEMEMY